MKIDWHHRIQRPTRRLCLIWTLGIMEQRYQNGAEIHLADVVSYNGQSGRVVFVADRREYSAEYPELDWPPSQYPTGFMIEFSNGARLLLDSSDENLELISRKTD